MSVLVELSDGSKKKFNHNVTLNQVALSINEGFARQCIACEIEGIIYDMNHILDHDVNVNFITFDSIKGKEIFWHSSAHLMAAAVVRIFPDAKFGIGPAIEEGFYYDFDISPINEEIFPKLEEVMKNIVKEKIPFIRREVSKEDAISIFKNNPMKLELIHELNDIISVYSLGDFIDLCKGPHVPHSGFLKAVKLTKVSGAYWKGDVKRKSLQRIYGISFNDKKKLKVHFNLLEEAKKRDHRILGAKLDMFSFSDYCPGHVFWHDRGNFLFNTLINFWRIEHRNANYLEIKTPLILNEDLWKISGHMDYYKENMYFVEIDGISNVIKPMNCPGGIIIYKTKSRSYRDLPLRVGEVGQNHRHELSGVLHGLMRIRAFHQDDAHIYCTREQVLDEIKGVIELTDSFYSIFGFEYFVELSTKPEKAMGDPELWILAEKSLKSALNELNVKFIINEGDGAFYGPKIDFHIKDSLNRTWQCATCQLDFQLPERFQLEYVGRDNKPHRPVMLHRTIYGSVERFIGILLEHFAGKLPFWINPMQIRIMGIADRHMNRAFNVAKDLKSHGFRVDVDNSSNTLKYKIRIAQLQQYSYILVIGDNELKSNLISVRSRDNNLSESMTVEVLINNLDMQIKKYFIKEKC